MLGCSKNSAIIAFWFALVFTSFHRGSAADPFDYPSPYWLDEQRSCGPFCVSFLDKYYGGEGDYRSIATACPPGPSGVTLAQVKETVEQLGYHTFPFEGSATQLKRLQHPAVLHYRSGSPVPDDLRQTGNHFVVFLGWNEAKQTAAIFNPPNSLQNISFKKLKNSFAGIGLVVSDVPLKDTKHVLGPAPLWPWLAMIWSGGLMLGLAIWNFWRPGNIKRLRPSGVHRSTIQTIVLVSSSLIVGCHDTDEGSAQHDPPQSATHFDAGDVLEGTIVKHIFQIINSSDKPMLVKELTGT